jgi:hypothetical protein
MFLFDMSVEMATSSITLFTMITLMTSLVVNRRNVCFEIAARSERVAANGTRITRTLVSGLDMLVEMTVLAKGFFTIIKRTNESLVRVNGLNVFVQILFPRQNFATLTTSMLLTFMK